MNCIDAINKISEQLLPPPSAKIFVATMRTENVRVRSRPPPGAPLDQSLDILYKYL